MSEPKIDIYVPIDCEHAGYDDAIRKNQFRSIYNYADQEKFKMRVLALDAKRVKREMDGESCDKEYNLQFTSFGEFLYDQAEVLGIRWDFWKKYVNDNQYLTDFLSENDYNYFAVEWSDKRCCWEEAGNADGEYSYENTQIVCMDS